MSEHLATLGTSKGLKGASVLQTRWPYPLKHWQATCHDTETRLSEMHGERFKYHPEPIRKKAPNGGKKRQTAQVLAHYSLCDGYALKVRLECAHHRC
jgi:hypothetical protein